MTDYTELKRLAEAANAVTGDVSVEMTLASEPGLNQAEIDSVTAFMGAATPAAILALIAENEELGRYLCTCRDCGGEGSLHTGDWHSYGHMEPPEPVMEKCGECDGTGLLGEIQDLHQVITERDQLKAESEALRKDAERYQWLREARSGYIEVVEWIGPHATGIAGEDLDALLDAAIGKGEQS